jgi:ferredoxin
MPAHPPPHEWTLHLAEGGHALPASNHRTLLQTLQAASLPWPASCRNGSCRACIGQLVSGSVRYGVDWPGLLPEEKACGAVLPCVAYPTSDVCLSGPRD